MHILLAPDPRLFVQGPSDVPDPHRQPHAPAASNLEQLVCKVDVNIIRFEKTVWDDLINE